jgi:hypothetical protein
MEKSIRAKIIAELSDLIEGYTFESLSSRQPKVYRGVQRFDPDIDPPPLITILPRIEENQRTDYGMDEKTMPVDIICLERIESQNPSDLGEDILAELIACVFGKETTVDGSPVKLGGMSADYIDDIIYRTGGIDAYPDDLSQPMLHVGITVSIKYQTNAGDPFNQ